MALKAISHDDGMQAAVCFANNPNNVSDVIVTYTDETKTSGWYASNISLSTTAEITLTSRPEAGPRPSMKLDLARVAHLLIQLSDGRDFEFGTKPKSGPTEEQLAIAARANHGEALRRAGKLREAEAELLPATNDARRVFGAHDPNLPHIMSSLGTVYFDGEAYDRAEPLYREACDLFRAQSPSTTDLAQALNSLGLTLLRKGDLDGAGRTLQEAVDLFRALNATRSMGYARALHNLGVRFGQAGQFVESGKLLNESLDLRIALFGENHPETLEGLASLGTFWLAQGNIPQAEALHRRALEITRAGVGENHMMTAERYFNLALVIKMKRTFEAAKEAEPLLRRVYEIRRGLLGDAHPMVLDAKRELDAVQRALGIS